MSQPISLLICALGGEGGGVLSSWLMDTARRAGFPAQSSSIPGVAQRTGATTYYVEVWPTPLNALQGQRPVFSLNPVPGALDALLSSELLETARQVSLGLVSPDRTRVFSSSGRSLTTQERISMGDGRADSAALLQLIQQQAKEAQVWDFSAMAKAHGTMVSAVMLGVVAGSGLLPFARVHFEASIQGGGASAAQTQASLKGFAAGFERAANAQALQAMLQDDDSPQAALIDMATTGNASPAAVQALPAAVREFAQLGYQRLLDYQGAAYADLYVARLQTVLNAENAADPAHVQGHAASRHTARWLALWMAFDDIVRVADLKSRASRWQRVAAEVKLQPGELLRVYDHFKPGVPELAALLPNALATPLLRWHNQRLAKGLEPLAWALKIGSHSVLGLLALRGLASLKWLRPHGSRFGQEQTDIRTWLQAITTGLHEDWALGCELAQCGQLIKGYGSTNERAKRNLQHILVHLASAALNPSATWRAQAVAQARAAALQDEEGVSLNNRLTTLGAATLPVAVQPLRFVRDAARRP
jgi:indolepyruvate ferredoxin oxidoreductase, beta subunit